MALLAVGTCPVLCCVLPSVVGEFDFVQGVSKNGVAIRIFSPPGRAEQGRFALDAGVRALDFYDSFFKVHYPLPKLDMICITEFAMVRLGECLRFG